MKKGLIFFSIIFFILLTINSSYCAESFYMDIPYEQSLLKSSGNKDNHYETNNSNTQSKVIFDESSNDSNTKTNWFSRKFSKKNSKSKSEQEGYSGNLPNIERNFDYKRPSSNSSRNSDIKVIEEVREEDFKPAPFDDTLFLDKIIKKEKPSNYINDIQKTKYALNNLKNCIEQKGDIQRFNGCVNMIDLQVKSLKTKYDNQSDSLRESYIDILTTNYYAKALGNLMYDAQYYARYIPTQEGKYSKTNIEKEKADLLNRINKTIFAIVNES